MIRTAVATVTAAVALAFGCGVAHADPTSDTIAEAVAAFGGSPALSNYLNLARTDGILVSPDDVFETIWLALYYCVPSQTAQERTRLEGSTGLPPVAAAAFISALRATCPVFFP